MSPYKIIISNSQMSDMAHAVRLEVSNNVLADTRSIDVSHPGYKVIVTFADDIPSGGTRVQVWLNKVNIAEQLYHNSSEDPWDVLDLRLENNVHRGLVKYFYGILLDNYDLMGVITKALADGNSSVKLPNGQTLYSEIRHGGYSRTAGIRQKDNYPVFSLQADEDEGSIKHILSNVSYHWTDPGLIYPGDHYIEIPREVFAEVFSE